MKPNHFSVNWKNEKWIGTRNWGFPRYWVQALSVTIASPSPSSSSPSPSKSMATGLIYVQTDFEAIWKLLPKDIAVLTPVWYQTMRRWQGVQFSSVTFGSEHCPILMGTLAAFCINSECRTSLEFRCKDLMERWAEKWEKHLVLRMYMDISVNMHMNRQCFATTCRVIYIYAQSLK